MATGLASHLFTFGHFVWPASDDVSAGVLIILLLIRIARLGG